MSPRTCGIVLFCVLALLLPLPLHVERWGCWPLLRALQALETGGVSLALQVLLWTLLLAIASFAYSRAVPALPPKWGGALVGLLCWLLLLLLSTVPVARAPFAGAPLLLLRDIY